MHRWVLKPPANLIGFDTAPEIYIDDIGALEFNGSNVRLYLVSNQLVDDRLAGCVAVKLIGPQSAVPGAVSKLMRCFDPQESPPLRPFVVK